MTIEVFPDANHSLKQCNPGGVRESADLTWNTPYADGYFEASR